MAEGLAAPLPRASEFTRRYLDKLEAAKILANF